MCCCQQCCTTLPRVFFTTLAAWKLVDFSDFKLTLFLHFNLVVLIVVEVLLGLVFARSWLVLFFYWFGCEICVQNLLMVVFFSADCSNFC